MESGKIGAAEPNKVICLSNRIGIGTRLRTVVLEVRLLSQALGLLLAFHATTLGGKTE